MFVRRRLHVARALKEMTRPGGPRRGFNLQRGGSTVIGGEVSEVAALEMVMGDVERGGGGAEHGARWGKGAVGSVGSIGEGERWTERRSLAINGCQSFRCISGCFTGMMG